MDILYNAFGWVIKTLFELTGNYSLSIILMTIIFNLALLPMTIKQTKSMEKTKIIQPKMQEIQKKYANDRETMNRKMMELYKEHNYNPLSGCLPLLIQLPIIVALFTVMREPMVHIFAKSPELGMKAISQGFLWVKDLSMPDMMSNIFNFPMAERIPGLLPIITAVLTYFQIDMSMPKQEVDPKNPQPSPLGSMKVFMPMMMFMFSYAMASGLVLYWAVGNAFRIVQQMIITKKKQSKEVI